MVHDELKSDGATPPEGESNLDPLINLVRSTVTDHPLNAATDDERVKIIANANVVEQVGRIRSEINRLQGLEKIGMVTVDVRGWMYADSTGILTEIVPQLGGVVGS